MLTRPEVVPYLLRRGLIGAESVVDGDLEIVDASRRNHNFGILRKRGPSYLLKQGTDDERKETIANEALVYSSLRLDPYLPRLVHYDSGEHVLVLEYLTDARDLHDHQVRTGRFSTRLASSIGHALSTLHRKEWRDEFFVHRPPWVLSIHRPNLKSLCDTSGGNLQVIKIVQQYPEYCELLDALSGEWRADAFIHFDLKWDHCLVSSARLKIIDWEIAGVGDADWDVGSVFSSYLNSWLRSIPITGETPPDRFLQYARYPLEKIQPALRAFWSSYARDMDSASERLLRAVRYAAGKLTQTAYEQMQTASDIVGTAVCALQLGLNILRRPAEAARDLLGIA
jgi:thiamine kinase-like enzyme